MLNGNVRQQLLKPLLISAVAYLALEILILGINGINNTDKLAWSFIAGGTIMVLLFIYLARLSSRLDRHISENSQTMRSTEERLKQQMAEQTRELEFSHKNYQTVVESANSIILRWDQYGVIRFANSFAINFFGFTEAELLGKNILDTIVPDTESTGRDLGELMHDIGQNPEKYIYNENENICKNSDRVWVAWTNKALRDAEGNVIEVLSIGNDITDVRSYQQRIYELAHFDTLTRLPNRTNFMQNLQDTLEIARMDGGFFSVFYLDLDRFKPINDSLGHHCGDNLLKQLAERLNTCLRETDLLARMAGDEFTVILSVEPGNKDARKAAETVATKMLKTISAPFRLDDHEVYITGSIGIALYPQDGSDAATLLKNADTAMYAAKESGRNHYLMYQPYMNARSLQRLQIETELRKALENNGLDISYQPIISLDDNELTHIEALARWKHPTLGDIEPNQFIPVAEETGLIVPLGLWVLEQSVQQMAAWERMGIDDFTMTINLSLRQFKDPHLIYNIETILHQNHISPSRISLELTESTLMEDSGYSLDILMQLSDLGLRLIIDDFGTGYSSLERLRDLPISTLKIDRSFVADIGAQDSNTTIIDMIIAMAHSMKVKVIAEGVENASQLAYLMARNCDSIQGQYISDALTADKIETMLQEHMPLLHQQKKSDAIEQLHLFLRDPS